MTSLTRFYLVSYHKWSVRPIHLTNKQPSNHLGCNQVAYSRPTKSNSWRRWDSLRAVSNNRIALWKVWRVTSSCVLVDCGNLTKKRSPACKLVSKKRVRSCWTTKDRLTLDREITIEASSKVMLENFVLQKKAVMTSSGITCKWRTCCIEWRDHPFVALNDLRRPTSRLWCKK